MVRYADNTLVMVGGRGWHETLRIHPVRGLSLMVSHAKSEAVWFFDKKRRGTPPPCLSISMTGETVRVGSRMRYLVLFIDNQ